MSDDKQKVVDYLNQVLAQGGRPAVEQVFTEHPELRQGFAYNQMSGQLMAKEGLMDPWWTKVALGAVGGVAGGALLAPLLAGGGAAGTGASVGAGTTSAAAPAAASTVGAVAPGAAAGATAATGGGLAGLLVPAAISGGAGLLGSFMTSRAASKAAQTQADAANRAGALLAPYAQAGQGAMGQLSGLMGLPGGAQGGPGVGQMDPMSNKWYDFQLQQGVDALQRSAAARGTLLTGGTLKDLTSFASGLASQQGDKQYDRLMGLAGIGENAAAGTGNYLTQAGNATAAGQVGSANAWSQGLSQLANIGSQVAVNYPWASKQQPGQAAPSGWDGYRPVGYSSSDQGIRPY